MRGTQVKKLKELVASADVALLVAVRVEYGDATETMTNNQLYSAAKKMYKDGKLIGII